MAEITNLFDAITKVGEDQCTNFFVWLLKKLPPDKLTILFNDAGIKLGENLKIESIQSQYVSEDKNETKPDAILNISEDRYLFIETKRWSGSFDEEQFMGHLKTGEKEFGKDKT